MDYKDDKFLDIVNDLQYNLRQKESEIVLLKASIIEKNTEIEKLKSIIQVKEQVHQIGYYNEITKFLMVLIIIVIIASIFKDYFKKYNLVQG